MAAGEACVLGAAGVEHLRPGRKPCTGGREALGLEPLLLGGDALGRLGLDVDAGAESLGDGRRRDLDDGGRGDEAPGEARGGVGAHRLVTGEDSAGAVGGDVGQSVGGHGEAPSGSDERG